MASGPGGPDFRASHPTGEPSAAGPPEGLLRPPAAAPDSGELPAVAFGAVLPGRLTAALQQLRELLESAAPGQLYSLTLPSHPGVVAGDTTLECRLRLDATRGIGAFEVTGLQGGPMWVERSNGAIESVRPGTVLRPLNHLICGALHPETLITVPLRVLPAPENGAIHFNRPFLSQRSPGALLTIRTPFGELGAFSALHPDGDEEPRWMAVNLLPNGEPCTIFAITATVGSPAMRIHGADLMTAALTLTLVRGGSVSAGLQRGAQLWGRYATAMQQQMVSTGDTALDIGAAVTVGELAGGSLTLSRIGSTGCVLLRPGEFGAELLDPFFEHRATGAAEPVRARLANGRLETAIPAVRATRLAVAPGDVVFAASPNATAQLDGETLQFLASKPGMTAGGLADAALRVLLESHLDVDDAPSGSGLFLAVRKGVNR